MRRTVFYLVALLVSSFLMAGGAYAGIDFGITSDRTKIGDSNWVGVNFGVGSHNIAISGDEVYVAFADWNDIFGCYEVKVGMSFDKGRTWKGNERIHCDGGAHSAAIAIGKDSSQNRVLHVAWGDNRGGIYYSRGVRDGEYWGWDEPLLVSGSVHGEEWSRSIAVDGMGGVHIVFFVNSATENGVFYNKSNDGGLSFIGASKIPYADYGFPDIAVDGSGNAYVAYFAYQHVYFTKKSPNSDWSYPIPISGDGIGYYPSIAVLNSNKIYVAWGHTLPNYNQEIRIASSSNGGASWSTNVVAAGEFSMTVSLAVDPKGTLHLAWEKYPDVVAYSKSVNSPSQWTNPQVAVTNAYFPNIAVDNSGTVYMMFTDRVVGRRNTINFTKGK